MKKITFFLIVICQLVLLYVIANSNNPYTGSTGGYPFGGYGFIPNHGQIHDQDMNVNSNVLYLLPVKGMNIQLRQGGFSYDIYMQSPSLYPEVNAVFDEDDIHLRYRSRKVYFNRVDVELTGSNPSAVIRHENPFADNINFYTYGVPVGGLEKIEHYRKVVYENIYQSIDLEFLYEETEAASGRAVKYNFILHPGADIRQIRMKYSGASEVYLNNGNIVIKTELGELREEIPYSYYLMNDGSRYDVNVSYRLDNGIITFNSDNAVPFNGKFVIDPTPILMFGSYYGGDADDFVEGVAVDANNNIIVAGMTTSLISIATSGAHQTTYGGGDFDAFLVKFNSSLNRIWATYFGNMGVDIGRDVAVNSTLNMIMLTGSTSSTTGIATPGAQQEVYGGGNTDAFLARFDNDGLLQWATYLGGMGDDYTIAIAIDVSGNSIIGGQSNSTSGIATTGAHQEVYGGGAWDALLAKYNAAGNLLWATYYGGSGEDVIRGVNTDASNNININGWTMSTTNIATTGAHQEVYGGGLTDAYVARFNTAGILQWGTYYGGSGDERTRGIITDNSGDIFITGFSGSTNNIATTGVHQETLSGVNSSIIVKFNSAGVRQWGTYYGGSGDDRARGIAALSNGNLVITGQTSSADNISTVDGHQTIYGGGDFDAFVAEFTSSGSLVWGSYFGDSGDDRARSIAVNSSDNVVIAGFTGSTVNMVTAGTHQMDYAGGDYDGFIAVFGDMSVCNFPITTNVIPSTTAVEVQWTTEAAAVTYQIQYRRISPTLSPIFQFTTTNNFIVRTGNYVPGHIWVYRLRTNCTFGNSTWSPMDTVVIPPARTGSQTVDGISFEIYPNPASGSALMMTIQSVELIPDATVFIYDIQGKKVMELKLKNLDYYSEVTLPLSSMVKGTYVVVFQTDRTYQVRKFALLK